MHSTNRRSANGLAVALALTSGAIVHCSTDLAYLSSGGASDGGLQPAPTGTQNPIGVDGGGGEYTSNGTDFSDKFPQQCATAGDCAAGTSCCVLPLSPTGGTPNRFDKVVSSIECVAATECAVKGRAICTRASDCAPTENCTGETDPILVRLYASFCR